ncbi:MAG: hypothetical protein MJE66_24535, partial [Proteobacteria bacterium]|nr:hypothetical protein [Pseudomonadota bacterium]
MGRFEQAPSPSVQEALFWVVSLWGLSLGVEVLAVGLAFETRLLLASSIALSCVWLARRPRLSVGAPWWSATGTGVGFAALPATVALVSSIGLALGIEPIAGSPPAPRVDLA